MIISGDAILKLIENQTLTINPKPVIKEASIKVHLADQFGTSKNSLEQMSNVILPPKGLIIGKTRESITLPNNIAGLYDGYIGMATQGIFTHVSSMFIDPEFNGHITLEIFNASDNPVELIKDMRVGHVIFFQVAPST